MPGPFDSAVRYGRGPHERCADRKEGARLGVHRAGVADLHFPYVRAQENGNHTDVRWVTLTDASGRGLRFSGEPTLAFTAHDPHGRGAAGGQEEPDHPHQAPSI